VGALGLRPGDEVLVPAYHCGTEVEALTAAGLACRFYDATDTLEPDEDELERLRGERARALLLIHYFGFPQDGRRWRDWCRARQLLLIEDCAHAALATHAGRPVGADGDLAIFSLHKTLPALEGGVATGPAGLEPADRGRAPVWPLIKSHLRWAMARSSVLDRRLTRYEHASETSFALGPVRSASAATRFLLPRLMTDDVAVRRRANYARLLSVCAPRVPAPFLDPPPGACPLFFPLLVDGDGRATVEALRRAGIDAALFWPRLHPLFDVCAFPRAAVWHEQFVAVPCHQDLDDADLDRLEAALRPLL
jgi:dTDP-4-amino-4,6-dideoxygalactose transaminase